MATTSIYDNEQNVFELQSALRQLRRTHKALPLINPDGIFGEETTLAVISAQKYFGIPQTGEVDFETWTLLFEDFPII